LRFTHTLLDDLDHLAGARLNDHAAIVDDCVHVFAVVRDRTQLDSARERLTDRHALSHADGWNLLSGYVGADFGRRFRRRSDSGTDRAAYDSAYRAADNRTSRGAADRARRCRSLGEAKSGRQNRDSYCCAYQVFAHEILLF
jgi:hypothetical protein